MARFAGSDEGLRAYIPDGGGRPFPRQPLTSNGRIQKPAIRARHGAALPARLLADGSGYLWISAAHAEIHAAAATKQCTSESAGSTRPGPARAERFRPSSAPIGRGFGPKRCNDKTA